MRQRRSMDELSRSAWQSCRKRRRTLVACSSAVEQAELTAKAEGKKRGRLQPRPLAFALAHCALALSSPSRVRSGSSLNYALACRRSRGRGGGAAVRLYDRLLENCGGEVFLVEMAMTAANRAADRVQLEMGGELCRASDRAKCCCRPRAERSWCVAMFPRHITLYMPLQRSGCGRCSPSPLPRKSFAGSSEHTTFSSCETHSEAMKLMITLDTSQPGHATLHVPVCAS